MQPSHQLLLAGLCLFGTVRSDPARAEAVPIHLHIDLPNPVVDTIGPMQSTMTPSFVASTGDGLTAEIEAILGETENAIMQGIQDELNALLGNALGQLFDVSPISAVKSLQSMVKDGLTKQQKIEYQNYKVDYAWKKAHTELSADFATYYRELNLSQLTAAVKNSQKAADQFLSTAAFTNKEASAMRQALTELADTRDLEAEVKTVVNLGGKAVWMSEGERVSALNAVRADLYNRIKRMNQVLGVIRATYQYRSREIARNAYRQKLYRTNSNLNRTVGTRGTTYQTR